MPEKQFEGTGVTPLSATGTAVWYRPEVSLELPDISEQTEIDPEEELTRFETAREQALTDLQKKREGVADRVGEDEAEVFDAHMQFVKDPQIEDGVSAEISEGKLAEHAVKKTFERHIEQLESMDGTMAERADDLRDVRDRLLSILLGIERVSLADLPAGSVVLAERLTPSDTAQLDPEHIAGFATITGGRTSHAAIIARSLAIPAVVGLGNALDDIEDGTELLVDGKNGRVVPDPTDELKESASEELAVDVIPESVSTTDNVHIEVAANVGTDVEIEPASDRGADGIGLYRTEFLFLDRESPPDEDEQVETYQDALVEFPGERVVFRTLDVGGDKQIPYLDLPAEDNPFLGERGIRRSLGPDMDLFETQLRALLRAAGSATEGDLAIMFPLVSTAEEVLEAKAILGRIEDDLEAEGLAHAYSDIGIMVETPAAVLLADSLADHVDFFSIGTNDLTQYVMAAERGNERVASLGDYRHPAVLRAIDETVRGAAGNDCWVGMCGEMAGDAQLTELLVGLGLEELSMSAFSIPAVKEAVRRIDTEEANDLAARALESRTTQEVLDIIEAE